MPPIVIPPPVDTDPATGIKRTPIPPIEATLMSDGTHRSYMAAEPQWPASQAERWGISAPTTRLAPAAPVVAPPTTGEDTRTIPAEDFSTILRHLSKQAEVNAEAARATGHPRLAREWQATSAIIAYAQGNIDERFGLPPTVNPPSTLRETLERD
jgi:hypothetical protein